MLVHIGSLWYILLVLNVCLLNVRGRNERKNQCHATEER